jgi:glycosyltransferase involved in cell wall biosynthesis
MYKLIAFATHWGSRYGGINCFNYDLLSAVGTVFKQHVTTICVVTEASDAELTDAEEAFVKVVPLPYRPDGNRLSGDTARIVIQELQARKVLSTGDEIVWLGHDRITGEIALSAKYEYGGSTALIHHMSYEHYESFSEDAATAQKKTETQKSLFQRADVRLAVGPLLRDALIDLVHDETVQMLVPGLVSISPCQVPRDFPAIMSGRLDPDASKIKQGHLGVAAFSRFSRETEGLRPKLVLRGMNYEEISLPSVNLLPKTEAELKEFAERYAEAAINLHALPYTYDRTQLFRELASSTVAMMPSWHEGFGLVAWEAVAAGVPVIVSKDSGVYRLLAEEDQLSVSWAVRIQGSNTVPYFTEADVAQIVVHLKKIESNPEKARRTAERLRTKLLPKYTWAACAENLVESFGWDLRIVSGLLTPSSFPG